MRIKGNGKYYSVRVSIELIRFFEATRMKWEYCLFTFSPFELRLIF